MCQDIIHALQREVAAIQVGLDTFPNLQLDEQRKIVDLLKQSAAVFSGGLDDLKRAIG